MTEESAVFAPVEQEGIRADIGALFRGAIRVMLECLLEQEVREMVGARRYERLGNRKDHLNGTYLRRLLTSMGEVELAVPRTRHSGAPAEVVGRYKRRTDEVDRLVTTAYVQGVSTRDMTRLSQALMGEGISRSTVSRVTKVLGEQVEQLRRAPVDGPIPYLYLDQLSASVEAGGQGRLAPRRWRRTRSGTCRRGTRSRWPSLTGKASQRALVRRSSKAMRSSAGKQNGHGAGVVMGLSSASSSFG